jgi:hypothetical protein
MGPPAALQWLGELNPITSVAEVKAQDPKRQHLSTLVETWDAAAKASSDILFDSLDPAATPCTVSELIKLADNFVDPDNDGAKSFYEALETIGTDKDGKPSVEKIGHYLKSHKNMVVNGKFIRQYPSTRGSRWSLERVTNPENPVAQK